MAMLYDPWSSDIPYYTSDLPTLISRGPVKRRPKKEDKRRKTLPEVAAAPQVDLGGVSRTGQELYRQPEQPTPTPTGIDAAIQGAVERQTREPFAATVLSPAAHRLYLQQEASRLRRRRGVAREQDVAARREQWAEREPRPGSRAPESAIVRAMEGEPQYAPAPVSPAEREYQRQGDWLAERRGGEQAVRSVLGDVSDAGTVWTNIVRRRNAGQPLSDSDMNILAAAIARQRIAQRGGY